MSQAKNIIVFMGGWSSEREISLESGRHALQALRKNYDNVQAMDLTGDPQTWMQSFSKKILQDKNSIVFNALHGRWGEDGCIQGMLEIMKIPYSHSGVTASAIAMNKHAASTMAASLGVRIPHHQCIPVGSLEEVLASVNRPMVIKPVDEGSSVGVMLIKEHDDPKSMAASWRHGDHVMLQDYVAGRELTVGIVKNKALIVMEIKPSQSFFDYKAKYDDDTTDYIIPAAIDDSIARQAMAWAEMMHNSLGCRSVSRSDFRLDDTKGKEGLYFLEINTQPGLTEHSLLPAMASHCGISFEELVRLIMEDTECVL